MALKEGVTAGGVKFNSTNKWDLQLSEALIDQRRLADIFENMEIRKIELKSESYLWEKTGNICIEYRGKDNPSGIAITEADCWVHELKRDGKTLCYLMFPMERLKELARRAYKEGRYHEGGGDRGDYDNILIPLKWIIE